MTKIPEGFKPLYRRLSRLKNAATKKGYQLNNKDTADVKPFFIIGSGRSGTTLLRRIIIQAPKVHIPPETFVIGRMVALFQANNKMAWRDLVNLMLATIDYYEDFSTTFNLSSLRDLALALRKTPPHKRTLAYILDQFYKYHAQTQNIECGLWGDKTPLNTMYIDRIFKLFPDSKYIFLVRNGYDVAYSYYKTGLYKTCEGAAKRWAESNKNALRLEKQHKKQVLRVNYEEMVSNPEQVIPLIFSFLNIQFDSDYLKPNKDERMGDVELKEHHYKVKKQISTNSIGKGRAAIPKAELTKVEELVKPMHKLLGYE